MGNTKEKNQRLLHKDLKERQNRYQKQSMKVWAEKEDTGNLILYSRTKLSIPFYFIIMHLYLYVHISSFNI